MFKKWFYYSLSYIVGLLIPIVTAYVLYAEQTMKEALPIWLLITIGLFSIILFKMAWDSFEAASIATKLLIVFIILDILLIFSYQFFERVENGEVIISDNLLFLVITTSLAGLFSILGAVARVETDVNIDKEDVEKINQK